MAAIHETAHGMVGKHFGATIEKMGFSLLYFAPSFFCDATQVWVVGGKWARIATAIAGIWLDLVVCFFATSCGGRRSRGCRFTTGHTRSCS